MHVEESSGSVFADLGLPDAEERLVKADLALEIGRILQQRQLTQRAAAELMGIDQPKVSHLLRGRLAGYSTERLLHFLPARGRDVEIVGRAPPGRRQGRIRVVAA
jgi:predicted XRE-type DNA-binding protein